MTDATYLFPSHDWIDAFCDALAAHPQAIQTAEALAGRYRFVIEPAGPLREGHSYDVQIATDRDGGAAVTQVNGDGSKPRLTLTADYLRWRELLEGRLDVKLALILRRLRVAGDLSSVTSQLNETKPLLDALSSVPTRWRDS
jgi:putative sterol carrier protein